MYCGCTSPVNRRFSSPSPVFWNARLILWRNWRRKCPCFSALSRSAWNSPVACNSRNFFSSFSGLRRRALSFSASSGASAVSSAAAPVSSIISSSFSCVYPSFSLPDSVCPVKERSDPSVSSSTKDASDSGADFCSASGISSVMDRNSCRTSSAMFTSSVIAFSWFSIRELNTSSVSRLTSLRSGQSAVYFPSNSEPLDKRSIFTLLAQRASARAKRLTRLPGRLAFFVTSARSRSASVYFISGPENTSGR